ncbi:MAG: DUF1902 domain-containing protein [Pseudomonadota bacterium]
MSNVIPFPSTVVVIVTRHQDDGIWVAECDALYLVTEAASFDEWVARVQEVAPDCIAANAFPIWPGSLRLRFEFEQGMPERQVG